MWQVSLADSWVARMSVKMQSLLLGQLNQEGTEDGNQALTLSCLRIVVVLVYSSLMQSAKHFGFPWVKGHYLNISYSLLEACFWKRSSFTNASIC